MNTFDDIIKHFNISEEFLVGSMSFVLLAIVIFYFLYPKIIGGKIVSGAIAALSSGLIVYNLWKSGNLLSNKLIENGLLIAALYIVFLILKKFKFEKKGFIWAGIFLIAVTVSGIISMFLLGCLSLVIALGMYLFQKYLLNKN